MVHFLFSPLDLNQHHDHLHHHHNHLDPHNDQAKNAKQKSAHSTHELRGDNELIYKMWVDGEPQIDSDQAGDVDCEDHGDEDEGDDDKDEDKDQSDDDKNEDDNDGSNYRQRGSCSCAQVQADGMNWVHLQISPFYVW